MEEKEICKKNYYHGKKPIVIIILIISVLIIGTIGFCLGRFNHPREHVVKNTFSPNPITKNNNFMPNKFGKKRQLAVKKPDLTGNITNINQNNITVKINDKVYTIIVSDSTSFTKNNEIAKQSDLKIGDNITIKGKSDSNGQINATMIIIK